MNTTTRPVRAAAIARMDENQDRTVAAIAEARQRPSAINRMAIRLNISEQRLVSTLKATVFRGASDDEFAALMVVADAYNLNPLLKEIYAFPVKGGGIMPMVSIDGWIRITNEHPQFDGIEFEDMSDDKGKLYAIRATIYRKDRSRPMSIIEYLEECKRNTDPWNKSPARMLRHRSLIQCARYCFGFSGIGTEDDAQFYTNTPLMPQMRDVSPPRRESAMPELTGETVDSDGVVRGGMAGGDPGPGATVAASDDTFNPAAADEGEQGIYDALLSRINKAATVGSLNRVISEIPDAMRDTWQTSLRDRAVERDAELRATPQ